MTDIPPAKAQLLGRTSDFDKGRTAAWMASLSSDTRKHVSLREVRDSIGHTIHVVSDRPFEELTSDLRLGLRLMAWMSDRPITWYWWDQPWARVLPAGVDPGPEHINGGWAVVGIPEVHVYRREEAHKVLIHECIHALGLDVPESAIGSVRAKFESALGRRLWPHLGEAFTEFFAEWLWATAADSLATAKNRWAFQLACSKRQAAQVWARIHDSRENEETNVFAYYVLKWVLMGHTETVLLSPDITVGMWYGWWLAARPRLDAMSRSVSESEDISMGMTCGYSSSPV
jgi:hypothetical protein